MAEGVGVASLSNLSLPNRDLEIAAELGAVRPDLLTHQQIRMLAQYAKAQRMAVFAGVPGLHTNIGNNAIAG